MLKATLAFIALSLFSAPAFAAGIDCTKATGEVDKIICSSDELMAEDKTMAELYALAKVNMFGNGPSGEIARQRSWLAEIEGIDKEPDVIKEEIRTRGDEIYVGIYKDRIVQLAFDVMPSAPEKALQILNDQKIKATPVYEALSIFASEPDGSNWSNRKLETKRKQILDLATPTFQLEQNVDAPSNAYGSIIKGLLDDAGIKTPEDILKSSKFFGEFLRAATYGNEGAILPCGFVITHPGLLVATASLYGSTMDNDIMYSNCIAMAPPTPKFTDLVKQTGGPDCEGTIRYGSYRSFAVAVDEALAPSERLIKEFAPTKAKQKLDRAQAIAGLSKSEIQSATRELADYYVKYLKAKPGKAKTFAIAKIAQVLKKSQQCDG